MSEENILYNDLKKLKNLKIGWHLTRRSMRNDFIEPYLKINNYRVLLDENLLEIKKRLENDDFKFSEAIRIEVPKKGLGVRPGTVISINDAIVLNTIIYLCSIKLNNNLPDSVYSYRLKDSFKNGKKMKNNHSLFVDNSCFDLPFLKKSTIYKRYLSYNDWYITWSNFDKETKNIVENNSFKFMATSDISAYFENIQLPLFKAEIVKVLNNEQKIVNLLFDGLFHWTIKSNNGESLGRGLPQGNDIFSFLGNYFLLPIDKFFEKHPKKSLFKYFRYMDDIRIFTNCELLAKELLLDLNRELRKLHLNTQSAKTKISRGKEIKAELIDPRLEEINEFDSKLKNIDGISKVEKNKLIGELEKIIDGKKYKDLPSIKSTRKQLEELQLRLFLRYINFSCVLNNTKCINFYFRELAKSYDSKILNKLSHITTVFSNRSQLLERKIWEIFDSDNLIIPYQKAECIKSIRYLNNLSELTKSRLFDILLNQEEDFYIRMQCSFTLNNFILNEIDIRKLEFLWDKENNVYVQEAISFNLFQRKENVKLIDKFTLHPNNNIKIIGNMLSVIRNNSLIIKEIIRHSFDFNQKNNLLNNIILIYGISSSNDIAILKFLSKYLSSKNQLMVKNINIRSHMKKLNIIVKKKISYLSGQ